MASTLASHVLACPVVFISTLHEKRRDIMTATAMFVSEKDSILVVSLAKGHLTCQLAEKAGGFTVVAAAADQEDLYEQLTGMKGEVDDKFKTLSISTLPGDPSKPSIPNGAAAWFECKTLAQQEIENYVVYIARVTAYEDLGKDPMIWQKESLFSLKAV